jgi:hypothetical protein
MEFRQNLFARGEWYDVMQAYSSLIESSQQHASSFSQGIVLPTGNW